MTFWFSLGPYLFYFYFLLVVLGVEPLPTRHMLYRAPVRTKSSNRSTHDLTELMEQTQWCSRMWEQRHRTVRAQDGAAKYQRLQWTSSQALLGKAAHLLQPCWNVHLLADCSFPRSASLNLSRGSEIWPQCDRTCCKASFPSFHVCVCPLNNLQSLGAELQWNFNGMLKFKEKNKKTKELPKHGGSTAVPAPVTLEQEDGLFQASLD